MLSRSDRAHQRMWIAAWIGLTLGGSALVGCEWGKQDPQPVGGPPPPVSPMQHPLLQNIPLPAGFQMVPERSVARSTGTMRVAQCEFRGAARPTEVASFYEKHMPTAGYELKEKKFDGGEYLLRFESDSEVCNIRAKPVRSQTALVLDVGPLSRGMTGREARPVTPPQP